jgi:hypothetical protein
VLLDRHPRDSWRLDRSSHASFWLAIHDGFRHEIGGLEAAGDDFLRGRAGAPQLAAVGAPRVRGLIAHLRGHHEVEDFHYFPAFREQEPRLARGFDTLAADHAALQQDVDAALAALRELLAAAARPTSPQDPGSAEHAAERFIDASARLGRHLTRHLADEEDLVVPLLLERGL